MRTLRGVSDDSEEPRDLDVEIRGSEIYLYVHPRGNLKSGKKTLVQSSALQTAFANQNGVISGVSPTRRYPMECAIELRPEGLLVKIQPLSQKSSWWVIIRPADLTGALGEIHLQWHGPYSIVDGTGLPNLLTTDDEAARHPGVYLWTIPFNGEELIHYVGKAEQPLRVRAKQEFRMKHGNRGWIPDPDKLSNGIKEWVYAPHTMKKANEEAWAINPAYFTKCWDEYLKMLRVYIAPMPEYLADIRDAETALMWAVWDHENSRRDAASDPDYFFLTNGHPVPKRVVRSLSIRMSTPARFRGLGSTISNF